MYVCQFSSVQFSSIHLLSHVRLFATSWTAARQASLSITNSPGAYSNSCHQVSDAIQLSLPLMSLLLPLSICPSIRVFPNESVLRIRWLKYWSSASALVLPMNIQDWFPLGWLLGSPCSPRDSHESSPTPQFKNIHFLVLSFLYIPTLTSTLDYRKNHSFDKADLCWQNNVSAL